MSEAGAPDGGWRRFGSGVGRSERLRDGKFGLFSLGVHYFASLRSGVNARMPTLAEFTAQLGRCAQSPEEVRDFIEAFAKVRLRYIARSMTTTRPSAPDMSTSGTRRRLSVPVSPNWNDPSKLIASGLTISQVAASTDPDA